MAPFKGGKGKHRGGRAIEGEAATEQIDGYAASYVQKRVKCGKPGCKKCGPPAVATAHTGTRSTGPRMERCGLNIMAGWRRAIKKRQKRENKEQAEGAVKTSLTK